MKDHFMDFPLFSKLRASHVTLPVRTTGDTPSFRGPSPEAAELMRNLTPNCDERGLEEDELSPSFVQAAGRTNIGLAPTTRCEGDAASRSRDL